ncbi:MAG TPA: AsmA family protein [Candidatus Acidoferrales bacterium]|nr:AsmA family protein [Candidatus Acidoferrales bacterium]
MKRLALLIGCLVVLLFVTALAVPFFVDPNRFRPLLEQQLTQALARDVKVGNLKLSILAGAVTADDLSIADNPAFSHQAFVQAKSLAVGIELWPLITARQVRVTGITIDRPSIALIQSASGEWNFSNLGGAAAPKKTSSAAPPGSKLDLSVKVLKIAGGRFSLDRSGGRRKPLMLDDVDFEVKDLSASAAFPFSLAAKIAGGGTIKLDGTAGPLDASDIAASPFQANFNLTQLDVVRSGASQDAPALSGIVSLAGTCQSDGKSGRIKAKLKGDKLRFAKGGTPAKRTVELDIAAVHNMRKRSGRIDRGDIHIGAAPAHLTGTYAEETNGLTSIHMTLDGPKMPIPDLAEMLPAAGIVLPNGSSLQGGTASVKLTMEGPLDRLVTAGAISFDNTKLTGFDMPKKMASIERFAGIKGGPDTEIQTLAAALRMGPDGISASNMQLILPAIGTLSGNGTVSPGNALDFKMVAMAHTSGLMSVIGNTPIPFTVGGTAQEPVFRPDVKAVVKGEAAKAAGSILKGLLGGK